MVHILPLPSFLIVLLSLCVKSGRKGPKLYSGIVICVVSWLLGIFLSFPEDFSLALHILSPWYISWPLSTLSHSEVLSLPLLRQLRVVVLFSVPPLCDPPYSLTHILQGILLVNRRKLTLTRHVIIMYLLVAPSCTCLRPVLVLVL